MMRVVLFGKCDARDAKVHAAWSWAWVWSGAWSWVTGRHALEFVDASGRQTKSVAGAFREHSLADSVAVRATSKRWATIGMVILALLGSVPVEAFYLGGQVSAPAVDDRPDRLWQAAREGDLSALNAVLADGVDVNAATAYGSTALSFAADRGHLAIVERLLDSGADPNVKDRFYNATPLSWARMNQHLSVLEALLRGGADGADALLLDAIEANQRPLVEAILRSEQVSPKMLAVAKLQADAKYEAPWRPLFENVSMEGVFEELPVTRQAALIGSFVDLQSDYTLTFSNNDGRLQLAFGQGEPAPVYVYEPTVLLSQTYRLRLTWQGDQADEIAVTMGGQPLTLVRPDMKAAKLQAMALAKQAAESTNEPSPESEEGNYLPHQVHSDDLAVSQVNWPGFRGTAGRGIAEGQSPPLVWDESTAAGVAWKTPIPGLGNSCPTVWGDRLWVTTAYSEAANTDVRIGLYGDVDSVEDDSEYQFKVYCLDKHSGQVLWDKTLREGRPAVKRHSKSTHANPTVVTNGKVVVAFFGSEGLYGLDLDGNLLWSVDLGTLDSGWFYDAGYQWGFGSSPVLFEDRLIVQCDIQQGSFIVALDWSNGQELWRTQRDEIPTWSTPTVHRFGDLPMVITHGTRAARGYDVRDGQLLWELPGHSEIVVPTPFVTRDLIFLASGYAPIQPIIAVRPTARGIVAWEGMPAEVQPAGSGATSGRATTSDPAAERTRAADSGDQVPEGEATISGDAIAWSKPRGGPYMPTPIAYGDYLYVCANNGVLTCYDLLSGQQIYRERMRLGGVAAFTASPIAADGHLYFTAEDGRVATVKAGPDFELVGVSEVGGTVLSTPSISAGKLYFRTTREIVAIGN